MADLLAVLFNEPESYALADLTGAATDLRSAITLCQLYIDEAQRNQPSVQILEAICAAALVRYVRALGSGLRTELQILDVLAGLDPEDREMNRDFKVLRDDWIAHSVNVFEENDVLLWLMPLERGQMEIMDATVRERRVSRLTEDGMTNLKHHCDRILSALEKRLGEAKIAALAAARALPLQDIYSRRFSEPSVLGPESHSKARKQRPTPRSKRGVKA